MPHHYPWAWAIPIDLGIGSCLSMLWLQGDLQSVTPEGSRVGGRCPLPMVPCCCWPPGQWSHPLHRLCAMCQAAFRWLCLWPSDMSRLLLCNANGPFQLMSSLSSSRWGAVMLSQAAGQGRDLPCPDEDAPFILSPGGGVWEATGRSPRRITF